MILLRFCSVASCGSVLWFCCVVVWFCCVVPLCGSVVVLFCGSVVVLFCGSVQWFCYVVLFGFQPDHGFHGRPVFADLCEWPR